MILCVDLDPNAQIRIDTDDPDFWLYEQFQILELCLWGRTGEWNYYGVLEL